MIHRHVWEYAINGRLKSCGNGDRYLVILTGAPSDRRYVIWCDIQNIGYLGKGVASSLKPFSDTINVHGVILPDRVK